MTNTNDAHRDLLIDEAKIDIALDTQGNQTILFDLYADHCGGDDDAHYMIHTNAQGELDLDDLLPRTIAFLTMIEHITLECPYCDTRNTDTF